MLIKEKIIGLTTNLRKTLIWLAFFYAITTIAASLLQYYKVNLPYTAYNNFIIFRNSFLHLVNNKDLYELFPSEHFDFYKYSPTFAFLIAPFNLIGDLPGLILWNILNAGVIFYAIATVPELNKRNIIFILLFVFLESLTSIQNSQSNGLVAGLAILSFTRLEKRKYFMAAFYICLGAYIKIFSVFLVLLIFLYNQKWKTILSLIFWSVFLLFLPLLIISPDQLIILYKSWFNLLLHDQDISTGLSVAGFFNSWFGITLNKNLLVILGIILLSLPFLRKKVSNQYLFRILCLSSILIWMVIFNHKAESPTFIIAICGAAFWYFTSSRSVGETILIVICFVLTSLSPTDLFPRDIRNTWVVPYVLKAIPCIIIWLVITIKLLFKPHGEFQLKLS